MTDLGMKKAALSAAFASLITNRLDNDNFSEVTRAVLVHGWKKNKKGDYIWDAAKWVPLLEAAYFRMTKSSQQAARPTMVWIYWNAGQYQHAAKYHDAMPSSAYSAFDLSISIDLLCRLSSWEELELRMKVARALLSRKLSREDRSNLAAAMANAHWLKGEFGACKAYSTQISHIDIHWHSALLLPVKAGLATIGQQIRDLNQRIDTYEKSTDAELELALHGYRKRQLKSARLALRAISSLIAQANTT